MVADPIRVRANADQETAANLLVDKNLLALPVVDDRDHLLGIITQDDVADVLEEETTEDFERIGGSQPLDVPYRFASAGLLVRRRIGWLLSSSSPDSSPVRCWSITPTGCKASRR